MNLKHSLKNETATMFSSYYCLASLGGQNLWSGLHSLSGTNKPLPLSHLNTFIPFNLPDLDSKSPVVTSSS